MKLKTPKLVLPPLLKQICQSLEEKKAEDIKVLCVRAQSSITDYLVLATGNSEPHLRALRVELEKTIDQSGVRILGLDTDQGSGWLVVDAFDIMVHVFTAENRRKYALESLWKDAQAIPVASVLAETKSAESKTVPKPRAKKAKAPAAKKSLVSPKTKSAPPKTARRKK
jgi:ribosome-associated protein